MVIHAVKIKGESSNNIEIPLREEYAAYGEIIATEITRFLQPGSYSVNDIPSGAHGASLKQLILLTMGIADERQLHIQ